MNDHERVANAERLREVLEKIPGRDARAVVLQTYIQAAGPLPDGEVAEKIRSLINA